MATSLTRVKGDVKANTIFDLTFDARQKCRKSNFSSRALLCCLLMMKLISWGLVQQLTQVNLVDGLQSLMNQTFKEVEMHNIQCLYHDFLFSYIVSF